MIKKTLKRTLQTFSEIEEELDGCLDYTEVAMHVMLEQVWQGLIRLKEGSVKIRIICEILLKMYLMQRK